MIKLLKKAKSAVAERADVLLRDVEKRKGLYVYRPVLNGQEWHDWAVKHGVPKPLAADDFHVTIVYSMKDVKMIPEKTVRSIYIGPGYGDAASFAMLGPKGESLAVLFGEWEFYNRHHNFLSNGAVTTWPSYRPHMSISNDATDFELSDEALADAPIYINLGGEVFDEIKDFKDDSKVEGAEDERDIIVIVEVALSAAKEALEKSLSGELAIDPVSRFDLADVAEGHAVTKAVAKRLSAAEWAPDGLKEIAKEAPPPKIVEIDGRKFIEKEVTMTMGPVPTEVAKKLKMVEAFKYDDEKRKAYGWASVSTISGEFVKDLQGDTITTEAQEQFIEDLFKNGQAAKLEHEGEPIGDVVQGLVFSKSVQDALGIDLGMEGAFTVTHYTCEKTWAKVRVGDWMHSIAGTMLVEVTEAA